MKKRAESFIAGIGGMIAGIVMGRYFQRRREKKRLYFVGQERDKFQDYYYLLSHWLEAKNNGGNVTEYFIERGCQRIAVYGMGELANRLCEDLQGSEVEVMYGIDRDVCNTISRIPDIYSPEDSLPSVDAVVVTPFYAFDSIQEMLTRKVRCPVISIEEVIWSI
jgi:hypothetical protein